MINWQIYFLQEYKTETAHIFIDFNDFLKFHKYSVNLFHDLKLLENYTLQNEKKKINCMAKLPFEEVPLPSFLIVSQCAHWPLHVQSPSVSLYTRIIINAKH